MTGKVVSKIEDKGAVENIEDNKLLDCKQAEEDESCCELLQG